MSTTNQDIRPSPIAGTWYSDHPIKLRSTIERYLAEAAPPSIPGDVIALIVPHAGHIYSGLTAAHAFKTVQGKVFTRVVVISPSHQYYREPILTSGHQAYATPLGIIPIDKAAVDEISQSIHTMLGFHISPVRFDEEHSLEIELPFLQVVLSMPFSLVPIMLRDQSANMTESLGKALLPLMQDQNTLLVASTDLSHFYSQKSANQLDTRFLEAVTAFDPAQIYRLAASGEGQACGLGAVAAILWAAKEVCADKVTLVDYRTSAAVTHDNSSVVGYGAVVVSRTNSPS